jgi:hypothetical protein
MCQVRGGTLSQYEFLELVYAANEAGNTALTIYMSIVTGYLVVAYAVGASLNRLQIILINSLFLFFATAFTYSAFTSFVGMRNFTEQALSLGGESWTPSSEAENIFVLVVISAMVS